MKLNDLSGQHFGRWTVLSRAPRTKGTTMWNCVCSCGTRKTASSQNLILGKSRSCGCLRAEEWPEQCRKILEARDTKGAKNPRARKNMTLYGTDYIPSSSIWYKRASGVFHAAKRNGVPIEFKSSIELAAYVKSIAPERCPVFGEAFTSRGGGFSLWSPSIDKKDPKKGYVRGNIQVISMLANCMKRDADAGQLRRFAEWVLREQG